MQNTAALRQQIETALSTRISEALSPRMRVPLERTPCGVAALDELLQGGLAAGVITEVVGQECSGRTTLALAYAAAVTRGGSVCAWVDVADALDPVTVAANGVDLARLLWVRCGERQAPSSPAVPESLHEVAATAGFAASQPRHTGGGSPHPRSEGRDMPAAVSSLLQAHGGLYDRQVRRERKMIGTPGAANRPVTRPVQEREEQVNSDRMPARRGENLAFAVAPRCAEPQPRRVAAIPSSETMVLEPQSAASTPSRRVTRKPWAALDQALRTTDLLLQGGGFSLIVLDMGSMPPEAVWRIPLATWFRYRAACERSRVSLLLLTRHPCARSSAEAVVRLAQGEMQAENRVMTGMLYRAAIERGRMREEEARVVPIRKPPQSQRPGSWKSEAAWAQGQ